MMANTPAYYYKHFSNFCFQADSTYDSRSKSYKVTKIKEMHIHIYPCAEHENGINKLAQLLVEKTPIEFRSYESFMLIYIGMPKTIWLPNPEAIRFMQEDLAKNNGMMAYWDYNSVAFVTTDPHMANVLANFLRNVSQVRYNGPTHFPAQERGIILK